MLTRYSPLSGFVCAALIAGPAVAAVDNATLPEPVRVPPGHTVKAWSVGIGEVTYACREKPDQPGAHGWVFVSPQATLYDRNKAVMGKYYGGPTWESADGSTVKGKQLAVSPTSSGNLPLQLVRADQRGGRGMLNDVTYIQRLNTVGGVAPAQTCDAGTAGQEVKVSYQADYVFYQAGQTQSHLRLGVPYNPGPY